MLRAVLMDKELLVVTSGNVTDQVWMEYVRNQHPTESMVYTLLSSDSHRMKGRLIWLLAVN